MASRHSQGSAHTLLRRTAVAATRRSCRRCKDEAKGSVTVSKERATGKVGFAAPAPTATCCLGSTAPAAAKATPTCDRYAGAFGASPASSTVRTVTRTNARQHGDYTQVYKGVPVFGSMLRANVDKGVT